MLAWNAPGHAGAPLRESIMEVGQVVRDVRDAEARFAFPDPDDRWFALTQ
jgi:hypothetical protein